MGFPSRLHGQLDVPRLLMLHALYDYSDIPPLQLSLETCPPIHTSPNFSQLSERKSLARISLPTETVLSMDPPHQRPCLLSSARGSFREDRSQC